MKTISTAFVLLLVAVISMFCLSAAAFAADEPATTPTPVEDTITLSTTYPTIEALANNSFQFNITLTYTGSTDRTFDLKVTPPQGWTMQLTPLYETTKLISSITMEASDTPKSQSVQLTVGSFASQPEPGDYNVTLEAVSGDLVGKIDLTARVTARYRLYAEPVDNLYSLTAKSGKDNIFSIEVANGGSAPVENITFTADKTQGWEITFLTESISTLEAGAAKTVDMNIRPASKTVSGDYMVNVWVNGKQASAEKISIRVTVETSSVWGTVGVVIILLVVVGLVFTFVRFGRR